MNSHVWELQGRSERSGKETHYRYACCTDAAKKQVKYTIGECAYMISEEGEIWVGMIVDFFNDPSETGNARLRVVLRWFYGKQHIPSNTVIDKDVPECIGENELYFADDIDFGDNPLEVVVGKANVYQDLDEFEVESEKNDYCYLVRGFYKPRPIKMPRLRALEEGELAFLLNNPGHEEMYNRYIKAFRARNTYMTSRKNEENAIKKLDKRPYHAGKRLLADFTEMDSNEVDEETPIDRDKTREPTILDVLYGRY